MKKTFFVLLAVLSICGLEAQDTTGFRGTVLDNQHQPITGATVSLLKATDSSLIKTTVSDKLGHFNFVGFGKDSVLISIGSAGYKKYTGASIALAEGNPAILLPTIVLQPDKAIKMDEVVVRSKKALLVQDIDKTVVNVDAMPGSATNNALEILAKTPGVTVSDDGDINLNGKPGVLVLIDGRPVYMSKQDLAAYLKSLPAAMLDRLELMDNPPAKYDANGSAIINIRLKKNKQRGFTGNISSGYSQGLYGRYNGVANLNFNTKKLSVFGNVGYYNEKNYSNDRDERKFLAADGSIASSVAIFNQQRFNTAGANSRLGLDYSISSKTTIGLQASLNQSNRSGLLDYASNSYSSYNLPDSTGRGNNNSHGQRTNLGANLNGTHQFNDHGRELSVDINYLDYSATGEQFLSNWVDKPGSGYRDSFLYDLPGDIRIFTAQADYSHPLSKNARIEGGVKAGLVTNDNDSRYFTVSGNDHLPDYNKSNHFIYHENVYAAYINARKSWKKFGAQLGLRLENSHTNGEQLGNTQVLGSSFRRNYTGLFPTLFLSYKLDTFGNHTLALSMARRTSRPNYQQLNPFLVQRDNYSYTTGNPELNPQYQYRVELRYQYKQLAGVSFQYNRAMDIIFQVTDKEQDIFVVRPANIAKGELIVLGVNFSPKPAKWWSMNINVQAAHMHLSGNAFGEILAPSTFTTRVNVMNQFDLSSGWNAELGAAYFGRDLQGQAITTPLYRLFATLQKKIWHEKASIRLSAEDFIHSWKPKDHSEIGKAAIAYHTSTSDTQRFGLAFSWRFGKDNSGRKRKNTDNSAEPEKGRVE